MQIRCPFRHLPTARLILYHPVSTPLPQPRVLKEVSPQAVDRRLKSPVAAMHPDLTLPQSIAKAREASGGSAQQYGQQCSAADNKVRKLHVLVPKVARPDAEHNPPAVPCQVQLDAEQRGLPCQALASMAACIPWQSVRHGGVCQTRGYQ